MISKTLIVGLGNPGPRYRKTRHNAGFMAVERLAAKLRTALDKPKYDGLVAEARWDGRRIILLAPQTFMNNSGISVAKAARNTITDLKSMLVISDEVQLPLGVVRLRASGSAGGHNGLKSIIEHVGTQEFARLRIGVGEKAGGADLADHVLSKFRPEEQETLDAALERAVEIALRFATGGVEAAMNMVNDRR